jgi:hypothetical protein
LDHGVLDRVGTVASDALDGNDLAASDHGQQRDAAIDGAVRAIAARIHFDDSYAARAAIALRAALFAPGDAALTKVIEEGRRWREAFDVAAFTIERELEGRAHRPTLPRSGLASWAPYQSR